MYVYGGEGGFHGRNNNDLKSISVLNLNSLKWEKFQWLENYPLKETLNHWDLKKGSDIYKRHLFILKESSNQNISLSCWNIDSNSWSIFDVGKKFLRESGNLIVYKNFLVSIDGNSIGILNLDNINFPTIKSLEEQRMMDLFMNEEDSDVAFMVEDKTLPAHKEILIQKSQYFANLFNSGMIESRQQVIEIPNCKYHVFQEFLRFLYCGEVELDTDIASKLFIFAEKHLKDDLSDKCLGFLTDSVNLDNVYTLLDFAHAHDIPQLKSWCLNFCRRKIDMNTVSGLIEYLESQNNPEFIQLRDKALNVLLRKDNNKTYQNEDFIIRNIKSDTILKIAKFVVSANYNGSLLLNDSDWSFMEKCILNLKSAAFRFVEENFLELRKKGIIDDFPGIFLKDYAQFVTEELRKYKKQTEVRGLEIEHNIQVNIKSHQSDEEKDNGINENMKRGQKRREAIQDESPEENPKLKQTKKTPNM